MMGSATMKREVSPAMEQLLAELSLAASPSEDCLPVAAARFRERGCVLRARSIRMTVTIQSDQGAGLRSQRCRFNSPNRLAGRGADVTQRRWQLSVINTGGAVAQRDEDKHARFSDENGLG
jgi:hypothetical protein